MLYPCGPTRPLFSRRRPSYDRYRPMSIVLYGERRQRFRLDGALVLPARWLARPHALLRERF